MGTCSNGIETAQLIEIRSCLNKQSESIQTLINSTKIEINSINQKKIKIEKQIEIINNNDNNIDSNSGKIENNNRINNEKNVKQRLSQRKFPKPRTVKLYSKNIIEENNDNQQLLNAISLKMGFMRNMIRKEMNTTK